MEHLVSLRTLRNELKSCTLPNLNLNLREFLYITLKKDLQLLTPYLLKL